MRIKLSNKFALAVLAPLVMASLVACGSDDADTTTASSDSTSAASAEESEDSEAAAEGEEIDPDDFVSKMMSSMEEATTAHVEIAIEGAGQNITAEGDLDYSKNPVEMKLTMSIPELGDGVQMILVDNTMYTQMPTLAEGKFIKNDLDDPANALGSQLSSQMDPREQFKSIQGALKAVKFVGAEDVDGEELQHYTMVLDGSKMPNQEGVTMPDEINYDVWLDDENRMRQLALDTAGVVVTSTISDWGKKVSIKAPKANQIVEIPTP